MSKIKFTLATATLILGSVTATYAQQTFLDYAAFTSGGLTYNYPGTPIGSILSVPGITSSSLNPTTGIGAITYTSSSPGAQYLGVFLDIDNDVTHSIASDDEALAAGTPFAGETWEIGDAGGIVPPDPYDDAANNTLPNANTMTEAGKIGDVAFGVGVNFDNVTAGTETITITSSLTAPSSGFYLEQENSQDIGTGFNAPNYLSISASFAPSGSPSPTAPDGGSTLSAFAMGLMALAGFKNRFMRK
jgi:hypothetical protein